MDTESDETERICEITAGLLKSFQQMLLNSRRQQLQEAAPTPACPCGRECQTQQRLPKEAELPPPPQQLPQQPAVCSNVSNMTASFRSCQDRVVTSPSEIFLCLRLESWLDENGVLVLKPSVHRASSADSAYLSSAANNNTTTARLQTAAAPPPATSETVEDAGGDCCEEPADSVPEGCDVKELLLQLQQLQRLQQQQQQKQQKQQQQQQQQQQPQVLHHNNRRQPQPKLNSATSVSVSGRSRNHQSQQQPQPQPQPLSIRRERTLAKRMVSAGSGAAPTASAAPAAVKARGRRLQESGDAIALMKQLHMLLDSHLDVCATTE